jgi:hypothetical protein
LKKFDILALHSEGLRWHVDGAEQFDLLVLEHLRTLSSPCTATRIQDIVKYIGKALTREHAEFSITLETRKTKDFEFTNNFWIVDCGDLYNFWDLEKAPELCKCVIAFMYALSGEGELTTCGTWLLLGGLSTTPSSITFVE